MDVQYSSDLKVDTLPAQIVGKIQDLAKIFLGGRVLLLSGAGISTDSGIPDYRGPETINLKREPILHKDFIRKAESRKLYWARSIIGWPMVRDARPNEGHRAISDLERMGLLNGIITQNVDGLHQAAGSSEVLELHGSLSEVRCLDCGAFEHRDSVQRRLIELNPSYDTGGELIAPDGDVELSPEAAARFEVPVCRVCGGPLKPQVVFFGDTVPKKRVELAFEMLYESSLLFVVGSSLKVFSGYRFVREAHRRGIPVAILNFGATRGDPEAEIRIDCEIGKVLPRLVEELRGLKAVEN